MRSNEPALRKSKLQEGREMISIRDDWIKKQMEIKVDLFTEDTDLM